MVKRLVVAVIAAVLLSVGMAAPAAAEARYTFFQYNMAGNMNHRGHTELIVPAVVNSITNSWPTAISLNEVCENQAAEIYWIINANGGGYHSEFGQFLPGGNPAVCGGHAYGIALYIRNGDPDTFVIDDLPVDDAEKRKVICGRTRADGASPRLRACAAHLKAGSNIKFRQMDEIARDHLLPAVDRNEAVAFLGDTYLTPEQMTWATRFLFRHTAREDTYVSPQCTPTEWVRQETAQLFKDWVDSCNSRDLQTQHDYVMVSGNRARDIVGDATSTRWSDHLPVRGAATFN